MVRRYHKLISRFLVFESVVAFQSFVTFHNIFVHLFILCASSPKVIGYAANRIIGGKDTDEVHRSKELFVNAQWAFGGEGTGAPVHYHNTAWAAVYYGAKKWTLYPPRYQIMSHTQILQFWEQDMVDYHKRGIDPVTCVQMAGDVVIVPEGWGHGVLNIQETIAVATEFRPHIWRESGSNVYSHVANGFDNKKHAS